jgi:environmental stress-induced protein Ves
MLPSGMHRFLQPADYTRMSWRNGGGRTTEIASHPAGAALDAFDWRVSIADVAKDGPFSIFAGIDRTIVLLGGAGMRLSGGGNAVDLRAPYEPYAFSGDDSIGCTLVAGPVRDFNLMLRRGRAHGRLIVVRDAGARIAPARFRVCYAAAGALECLLPGHPPLTIATDHAVVVEDDGGTASAPFALQPLAGDAVALVAAIEIAA